MICCTCHEGRNPAWPPINICRSSLPNAAGKNKYGVWKKFQKIHICYTILVIKDRCLGTGCTIYIDFLFFIILMEKAAA